MKLLKSKWIKPIWGKLFILGLTSTSCLLGANDGKVTFQNPSLTITEGSERNFTVEIEDENKDFLSAAIEIDGGSIKFLPKNQWVANNGIVELVSPFKDLSPGKHVLSVTYRDTTSNNPLYRHMFVQVEDAPNIHQDFPENADTHLGKVPTELETHFRSEFQMFAPNKVENPGDLYPMILFLHGGAKRHNSRYSRPDVPELVETGRPFMYCYPYRTGTRWTPEKLGNFLDHVLANYPVDPNRVYLSGFSAGAHGGWQWILQQPERFAAFASAAPYGPSYSEIVNNIGKHDALKTLPIYSYHGTRDRNHDGVKRAIEALIQNGNNNAHFYSIPDGRHGDGGNFIQGRRDEIRAMDPEGKIPYLWDYLFNHTLAPVNQLPKLKTIQFPEVIYPNTTDPIEVEVEDPDGEVRRTKVKINGQYHSLTRGPVFNIENAFSGLAPGEHVLTLEILDNSDAWGEATASFTVLDIPNSNPTMSYSKPPRIQVGMDLPIRVSASDEDGSIVSVDVSINGINVPTTSDNLFILSASLKDIPAGQHYVTVTVQDDRGATVSEDQYFEILETTPIVLDSIRLNGTWQSFQLSQNLDNPIVILGAVNMTGREGATASVRNITSNSFEARIEEWNFLDGQHMSTNVSMLAISEGLFTFRGVELEARRISKMDHNWSPAQSFWKSFSEFPSIHSTLNSDEDLATAAIRIRGLSNDSYTLRLSEQEAGADQWGSTIQDGIHVPEDVGVLAIGSKGLLGEKITLISPEGGINHNQVNVNIPTTLSDPLVFASMQTTIGNDPCFVRIIEQEGQVGILLQEERSLDSEIEHYREEVSVLLLSK